jgi:S-adenosylmethionine decarboxylase
MSKEFYSKREELKFAGTHLLVELWNGKHFSSLPKIRKILKNCVKSCRATLLKISLHKFSPSGGISGVAIIAESHISIHTWPEYNYAALDIFVCGKVNPYHAISAIKEGFRPEKFQIVEVKRGIF